jgi:bacterial leucyl aminopeptidase
MPHLPISKALIQNKDATVIEVEDHQVEEVSAVIHKRLNRCGGFMAHKSLEEANEIIVNSKFININPALEYTINQQDLVQSIVDDIREENIRQTILKLSSFETRHYTSKSGIESSHLIKDMWQDLSKHRSDVKVEIFRHKHFPQPSVIMTIEGSEKADEIIILGGHSDSISDEHMAPGADDNASGIASITEVIRTVMDAGLKPKRTIKFMAYAAEEVGLFGSQEIARNFKKSMAKVMGVLQLDMTLYKGTEGKDIILISDYTNKEQNKFLGTLIDQYVKVPWGYSVCGYGCSDHASWSAFGYPASFPFESKFEDSSPLIHTNADVLDNYGGDASHSVKFSKLAAAFVVEMAN